MPEEPRSTFRYRILRYTPNLARDEWVNIGVLLEDAPGARRACKLIEEPSEIARVRRLHPNADQDLLRALPGEFEARFRAPGAELTAYLEKLSQTLSNAIQLSPQRGVLADDFDAELDRIYRDQVAPPPRARGGIVENTRAWIRARLNDVFRRHRILPRLERNVRVEEFTHPGDTFRFDYAYRNGARGYLQSIVLGRDALTAKAMAYSAAHILPRQRDAEFTAITDLEPLRENTKHQFLRGLFEEQNIRIVPMNRVEKFAVELRARLQ
ncbi:MAG TPA: DUF3037 domain-containing protein [archaeon]|nr:DUF3037 domain-containing protein [archaeon]